MPEAAGFQRQTYRSGTTELQLVTSLELKRQDVSHGFTTRFRQGEGGEPFGARERGDEDRLLLSEALGIAELAFMKQVHGSKAATIDRWEGTPPECDALASDRPGLGLVVHTADCVPLLFRSPEPNAVAVAHAGWRGTLAGVARSALDGLLEGFGGKAEMVQVVIGPAIRRCCFEVGDEVIESFAAAGRDLDRVSHPGRRGRRHFDLIRDNRDQLLSAGLRRERILDSGLCTYCSNDLYYSYRKEGDGVGRLMGIIAPASSK